MYSMLRLCQLHLLYVQTLLHLMGKHKKQQKQRHSRGTEDNSSSCNSSSLSWTSAQDMQSIRADVEQVGVWAARSEVFLVDSCTFLAATPNIPIPVADFLTNDTCSVW